MKTNVSRLLLTVISFVAISYTAMADQPISREQLPAAAQRTLDDYFTDNRIQRVMKDTDVANVSYEVVFADGSKVEFDRKGQWTEIKNQRNSVPAHFIPVGIRNYLKKNYPNERVVEIERDKRTFEVELRNGTSLKFNKKGTLIDIDR